MKHAGSQCLDRQEALLSALRGLAGLVEKGRGVFYIKSKAWLHFHEDPLGTFADLWDGKQWQRFKVDSVRERKALVAAAKRSIPKPKLSQR